ncbi:hypothetical protein DL765_001270 [Monosporascus sp. GIB2]|nr:hypothetical protein DL765_001270 [Monosporascus sp. GIB2]
MAIYIQGLFNAPADSSPRTIHGIFLARPLQWNAEPLCWSHIANVTGTKPWRQDIPPWFGLVESSSFKVGDEELYVYGITRSSFTSGEGVSSETVLGPPGEEGCYAANYDGLNVKGKIVLTQRYRCPTGGTLTGRVRPAKEAVTAAVIIYRDLTTTPTHC